jgi:glycosyltransferase involved in cell wall biosynthesis
MVLNGQQPSVLHVGKFYPPHSGGMETHLRDLTVRQAQTVSVSVLVANSSIRNQCSTIEGVQVTRIPTFGKIASMPISPTLLGAIRQSPSDLVHIHVPNPGAACAFLMSGHSGKLVITHHADTLGRNVLRKLSDPFVVRLMKRASRIIVTSSRYLASSEELAPFLEKCRVIPLGIDVRHSSQVDPEKVRMLNLQFGSRLVLAVGRLVPYKGFDVLIRAMKHVDGRLLLIGDGPQNAILASLIKAEGVQHKVTMQGRVADLNPYFEAASLFVLPSVTRAEAFGLVQLEAMAAGAPVINTDIDSGVPEVSLNGKTGITVPPGDAIALSSSVNLLLDRDDLRKQFGEAGKARMQAEFTADLMAERTMSIYREILG